jgi:cyclic pyranopterin phosphate synthase
LLRLTEWLHKKGMHVRLDTNGHAALMYTGRDVVAELKTAGLDAVSVSLNAESEEKYNRLCKPVFEGSYGALLDFTKKAVKVGIRTRMTVVWQQDINISECERIASELGASFKVRGA